MRIRIKGRAVHKNALLLFCIFMQGRSAARCRAKRAVFDIISRLSGICQWQLCTNISGSDPEILCNFLVDKLWGLCYTSIIKRGKERYTP